MIFPRAAFALAFLHLGLACGPADVAGERREVVLASTSSLEDSGLLDVLVPAFERTHPDLRIRFTAVGSGQALALGRRGDTDVLLVHAPAAEEQFMREGHGRERRFVMRNEFVMVGPADDPASVRSAESAADALARIARARAPFVSRGDDSGTHQKERAIWRAAGLRPEGSWYLDAGQGMGEVLSIADEVGAYALTDRGTYLSMKAGFRLEVLFEGDPVLDNPYHVITVAGARNAEGARRFLEWITGPQAQTLIGAFGAAESGRSLFEPAAR